MSGVRGDGGSVQTGDIFAMHYVLHYLLVAQGASREDAVKVPTASEAYFRTFQNTITHVC